MGVTAHSPEDNATQGDFGEAWLEVVAAAHGLSHGTPDTVDLDKADVLLTLREQVGDTYHPAVKVQVKSSASVRLNDEGDMVYDLKSTAYNVLRRTDHSVRRTLVVVKVSADGERVRLEQDGTLLVGAAAWVSLEGKPPTTNTASVAVTLPVANTVDEAGLRRMLEVYGVRQTTEVPEFNPWEVAP